MKTRIIGAVLALVLAVVGTVVLVAYVRGADARASDGAEFVDVYVVDETVPRGTAGDSISEFVSAKQLPALAVPEDRVTDLSDLGGLVTTAELLPGEQLLTARFVDPAVLAAQGDVVVPDGMQEVTVALDVQRVVGGVVRPGSTVGIVITSKIGVAKPGESPEFVEADVRPATQFTFQKVLVTRVQAGSTYTPEEGEESSSGPVQTIMVTLARTTPDIEKIVWAREMQEDDLAGIWLTLEPESASEEGSRDVNGNNILP